MGAKKEIKRLEEWEQHLELILAMVRVRLHRERASQQARRKSKRSIEPVPVQFVEVSAVKLTGQREQTLC